MLKKMSIGVVFTVLLISFSGCGGVQPKPYTQQVNFDSTIPQSKKQQIVNNLIHNINNCWDDIRAGKTYCSKDELDFLLLHGNCIYKTSRNYSRTYNSCFLVTKNDTIIREGKDYFCKNKDCSYSGKYAQKYVKVIDNTQNELQKQLPKKLKLYPQYSKLYDKEFQKAQNKFNSININIIDNVGLLSKKTIDSLKEKINKSSEDPEKVDFFAQKIFYDSIENFKEYMPKYFTINICPKWNIIGNLEVYYLNTNKLKLCQDQPYFNIPENVNIHIPKIRVYYLPLKFSAQDSNIRIEVNNSIKDKGTKTIGYFKYETIPTIRAFTIYNNTNNFITIRKISGYYGDEIFNLPLYQTISLPPKSYKNIVQGLSNANFPDFGSIASLDYTNKNKSYNFSVSYGFAISYSMDGLNIRKNLYRVKKFTAEDFLK